jgi:hypothetical protein
MFGKTHLQHSPLSAQVCQTTPENDEPFFQHRHTFCLRWLNAEIRLTAQFPRWRPSDRSPPVIGKRPSELFLVIDFLENGSIKTAAVDPKSGRFPDALLQFVCKNDFILPTYLLKTAIPVQMCRARNDAVTEIGKSELNLASFVVDRITAFSSSINIWNTAGKIIARINFEVALVKPLVLELVC